VTIVPGTLRLAVQCRAIVDNDWTGDPDGLVALAHHLLSPTNRVVGVTSSLINPIFDPPPTAAADAAALARELVGLVGMAGPPPVHAGSETPFGPGGAPSAAADAIVTEARREDALPLYLVCGGPLTNVAAALRQDPGIADRLILVWIGGSLQDAPEYNRDTDGAAAVFVLSRPDLEVWQFPLETYRRCAYSVAELEHDLGGSGRLGAWLWERFTSLPLPDFVELGGLWPLGDSPPVLVTALGDESSTFTNMSAAPDRGPRRVYTDVDFRLIVGDMLAKLRQHEASRLE